MSKTGRPTKFSKPIAREIIKYVRSGMLLHDAAELAGIDRSTLYRWLEEGSKRKGKGDPLGDFCNAVSKGKHVAKVGAVKRVLASKDWKAAAWWLGVTDPRHYGPRIRVTVDQEQEAFLDRLERKLPPEVFELVLEAGLSDSGGGEEAEEDSSQEDDEGAPPGSPPAATGVDTAGQP